MLGAKCCTLRRPGNIGVTAHSARGCDHAAGIWLRLTYAALMWAQIGQAECSQRASVLILPRQLHSGPGGELANERHGNWCAVFYLSPNLAFGPHTRRAGLLRQNHLRSSSQEFDSFRFAERPWMQGFRVQIPDRDCSWVRSWLTCARHDAKKCDDSRTAMRVRLKNWRISRARSPKTRVGGLKSGLGHPRVSRRCARASQGRIVLLHARPKKSAPGLRATDCWNFTAGWRCKAARGDRTYRHRADGQNATGAPAIASPRLGQSMRPRGSSCPPPRGAALHALAIVGSSECRLFRAFRHAWIGSKPVSRRAASRIGHRVLEAADLCVMKLLSSPVLQVTSTENSEDGQRAAETS